MRTILAAICVTLGACGGGRGGTFDFDCSQLTLADCRVEPACQPNECADCDCTPAYLGCIPADAVPAPCPLLDCPTPRCCDSGESCSTGTQCIEPGASAGCGACNPEPSSCASDDDCTPMGASFICDPIPCSCDGSLACTPGCVDNTGCAEGQVCNVATARCEPLSCEEAMRCPDNFSCVGDRCLRTTCTDDSACAGYCVNGRCFGERGTCQAPPP